MKIKNLLLLTLSMPLGLFAQNGYEIKVKMKNFKNDGYLYLAYHFGKKQMLVDSAILNTEGEATFKGTKKLDGGIYLVAFPKKDGWFEIVIDKELHFSAAADTSNYKDPVKFTGSPDNTLFREYQDYSMEIGLKLNDLRKDLEKQKTKQDSTTIQSQMDVLNKDVNEYRLKFIKEHPKHLLTTVFNIMKEPEIPDSIKDQTQKYYYYRDHFWDDINLLDARMLRTPVFEGKLDRYFDQIIPQDVDTLKSFCDDFILSTRADSTMHRYMLTHLAEKYVNPKFMGQDAVYVHIFQKYFIPNEDTAWMPKDYKKYMFERGYSLMANSLGDKGADIILTDTTGKLVSLYAVQAPYTVVCFWDPNCSHCQKEIPQMDTIYHKKWKALGVKLFGINNDTAKTKWVQFIRDKNLKDWIHVYEKDDARRAQIRSGKPGIRQLYDVNVTPTIYLLDKDKRIIAKKLTIEQLDDFLDYKIKKEKENPKPNPNTKK
ncbi:MAG: DUF5106 domain-containing protein [Chitinophagaceae bacterium]